MKSLILGLLGALLLSVSAHAAGGSTIESQYTDVDFKQCTVLDSDELGQTLGCPGYRGMPLIIADEDERLYVSYGLPAADEKSMQQGFGPFNDIGTKIEWRVTKDADGNLVPLATILRWKLADQDGNFNKEILVVTQLKLDATCQIALIDALAIKNANDVARKIADEKAGTSDCSKDPEKIQPFTSF